MALILGSSELRDFSEGRCSSLYDVIRKDEFFFPSLFDLEWIFLERFELLFWTSPSS